MKIRIHLKMIRYPLHKICSKAIHTDYELASVLKLKNCIEIILNGLTTQMQWD